MKIHQSSWWRGLLLAGLVASIAACTAEGSSEEEQATAKLAQENEALKQEVETLKAQVAELKLTPAVMLTEVDGAIKQDNLELAKEHQAKLQAKFPQAAETASGAKLVAALEEKRKAEEREKARIAALGLKALKVSNVFEYDGLKVQLASANISGKWIFDSYDDSYRYREAVRGSKFIVSRLNFTSKKIDPDLFGIAVYAEDGGKLAHRGTLDYRFVRWRDYGTFLGNDADFRNDFAHTATIPFSGAVQISNDQLQRPLYLVATRQGCHTRVTGNYGNPPVNYFGGICESLKPTLTITDFKDGKYSVLKRID